MIAKFNTLKRATFGVAALALLIVASVPLLSHTVFAAAAQVTDRSIELSDSTPSATGVTYSATFTPATAAAIKGMVIDFCSNDPIFGDSCTAPTGFSVGTVSGNTTVTATGQTAGTWTAASGNTGRTLELTNTTTTGTPSAVSVVFTSATNPSATGSFYARILTFGTSAAVAAWEADTTTGTGTAGDGSSSLGVVDYGGVALSTVEQIQITAKVMESLAFCTSGKDISGGGYGGTGTDTDCTKASAPDITIGHGTPTATIDTTAVDYAPAYTQLSTNATNGAIVRMKSTNTCAGLSSDGGATCTYIPGTGVLGAMTAGTAGFGLFVADSVTTTGVTSSTGTVTPDGTYHDPSHDTVPSDVYLAMDDTTLDNNVLSTYGSEIAACTGPVSQVNSKLVFGATASATTPAGIYTNDEILIATGTF